MKSSTENVIEVSKTSAYRTIAYVLALVLSLLIWIVLLLVVSNQIDLGIALVLVMGSEFALLLELLMVRERSYINGGN